MEESGVGRRCAEAVKARMEDREGVSSPPNSITPKEPDICHSTSSPDITPLW
jgi:hypothetical protein